MAANRTRLIPSLRRRRGDASRVGGLGERGAEGKVDAEQAHWIAADLAIEVTIADDERVGGRQRLVQGAEVGGPGQRVLVNCEEIEARLAAHGAGQQQQQERDRPQYDRNLHGGLIGTAILMHHAGRCSNCSYL